ncbi:hypothetical protein CWO91_32495 [Bradyrhizobium genosp. SA-3]|nr:hypothetical protein CWO91_32495 [Bradyrhizobium genosp. SA-3]
MRGEAGSHRRCDPGEGDSPRVDLVDIRRALSTSLRAQRSNPESFRGGILDCFAALAMTGGEVVSRPHCFRGDTPHPNPLSASEARRGPASRARERTCAVDGYLPSTSITFISALHPWNKIPLCVSSVKPARQIALSTK